MAINKKMFDDANAEVYGEKSHVSLEQKLCIICGKTHDVGVLLDTRLRKSLERNTVTGYDHCSDCQTKIDDNYIAMIEATNNSDKSTIKPEDANRTGAIIWVKKHLVEEIFTTTINTPMAFIEPNVKSFLENLLKTAEETEEADDFETNTNL